jgi:hypothetical protein
MMQLCMKAGIEKMLIGYSNKIENKDEIYY